MEYNIDLHREEPLSVKPEKKIGPTPQIQNQQSYNI
jgi:hypothetical protein